jgi:lysine-specific demethylase 3
LGLDFLSPESLGVASRLAAEIRCLPNEHEAKLQVLEVRIQKLSSKIQCHLFLEILLFSYQ